MEIVFRITLFIAGVINLLPALLAFLPKKISKSYGVQVPNNSYELLLRHRAVLFGIIGGLIMYSSIAQKYYEIATAIGLVSMISFIILYYLIGGKITPELKKVMVVDVIATILLLAGAIVYFLTL